MQKENGKSFFITIRGKMMKKIKEGKNHRRAKLRKVLERRGGIFLRRQRSCREET